MWTSTTQKLTKYMVIYSIHSEKNQAHKWHLWSHMVSKVNSRCRLANWKQNIQTICRNLNIWSCFTYFFYVMYAVRYTSDNKQCQIDNILSFQFLSIDRYLEWIFSMSVYRIYNLSYFLFVVFFFFLKKHILIFWQKLFSK